MLRYEKLEQRQMLASITFDSGEIVVQGDATDDVIELVGSADFRSFTVAINSDPSLTETFQYADVTGLTVFAGDGNDRVTNTLLRDTVINGGNGDDRIEGGFRQDVISGGNGADTLIGRHGNDILQGQAGIDSLFGSPGVDRLVGGAGEDRLFGGEGDDLLQGEDGDDLLIGDNGDDVLVGGLGDDRLNGSSGADVLNGNEGNDRITAGAGDDRVNGGRGDDMIFGSGGLNVLNGNGGNDTIFGGDLGDSISGGSDEDRLVGNQGDDLLFGGAGDDELFGGLGDDELQGDSGDDLLSGQQGDDSLFGGFGDDSLFGNDGADSFFVDSGDDRINGNAGVDRVQLFFSNEFNFQVEPSGPNFRLTHLNFTEGPSLFTAGSGNDLLIGIDEIDFAGTVGAPSDFVTPPIVERVIVQPIIVSDNDGSNTATAFGNSQQEAEIKRRLNRIYAQIGIDFEFLPTAQYNNSFVNGTGEGVRDVSDFRPIIAAGDADGVGSSDPLVVDLYFVNRVPGFESPSSGTNGRGFLGSSGSVVGIFENLPNSNSGRDRIAAIIGHEIGHNLGLEHTDVDTLLDPGVSSRVLTESQGVDARENRITRPI